MKIPDADPQCGFPMWIPGGIERTINADVVKLVDTLS
jgi:hypothetical protein